MFASQGSGFGAALTHVVQLGPYTTPTSLYGLEITAAVPLPQFDPSLGILNGVTISVQNQYLVEAAGETNTGLALPRGDGGYDWIGSYAWFVDVGFTWTGPGFTIETEETLEQHRSYTSPVFPIPLYETSGTRTLAGQEDLTAFGAYTGTGTVRADFSSIHAGRDPILYSQGGLSPGGFFVTGINQLNSAAIREQFLSQIAVTYIYTPVPEPSALKYLGICVFALFATRKRFATASPNLDAPPVYLPKAG